MTEIPLFVGRCAVLRQAQDGLAGARDAGGGVAPLPHKACRKIGADAAGENRCRFREIRGGDEQSEAV